MVPQEPFLFRGLVAANVTDGNAQATPEQVLSAARNADCHEFIMRMPFAYETQLGEGGCGLSGGERQRLSIARALLFDPAILILVEATASVDAESERAICRAIRRWSRAPCAHGRGRRTTIVTAHRLSTLQGADRLLVSDQGRLVEQGTAAELLEQGELYSTLARIQYNLSRRTDSQCVDIAAPGNASAPDADRRIDFQSVDVAAANAPVQDTVVASPSDAGDANRDPGSPCLAPPPATTADALFWRLSRRVGFSPPLRAGGLKPTLRQAARRAALAARRELQQIASLTGLCRQFSAMDFRFLFHPQRKLLAVGFNVSDRRWDESYYDLLASEARLTSFLAVSHGQLPLEHWFALGRMVTVLSGTPALLSWSGSMFEYLLPMLIMPYGASQRHDALGAGPCAVGPDDAATLSAAPALRGTRHPAAGTRAAERLPGRSGNAPCAPASGEKWPLRTSESITVTLSPFAPRKPHLSRSERRHLFPCRS
jgi:ABC-type thiamine transport system ATPase subunit